MATVEPPMQHFFELNKKTTTSRLSTGGTATGVAVSQVSTSVAASTSVVTCNTAKKNAILRKLVLFM